jgi:hypothetical protein
MHPFTYVYEEESFESGFEHFMEEDEHRFRVTLEDGEFVLAPMPNVRGPNNMIIWGQVSRVNEIIYYERLQAIGAGIEKVYDIQSLIPELF